MTSFGYMNDSRPIIIIFKRLPSKQPSKHTDIKYIGEHNGLQRTSWQQRYFEKKPRFPFEVPRTAAETDVCMYVCM